MNVLTVDGVRLAGVAAALPAREIGCEDALRPLCGERAAEIVRATGIRSRRVAAAGTAPLDLCVRAAEKLLSEGPWAREDFGAVIFVSFTGAERMPAAACQAQARLGLGREIAAFDVGLACSGYAYGLYLAATLARSTGRCALLLAGDVQSPFLAPDDFSTLAVLADGGTASVVECRPGSEPWRFAFASDGAAGAALRLAANGMIAMDGYRVFRFVSIEVTAFLRSFLASVPLAPGKVAAFVPHQANVCLVRGLARSLRIADGRTWISAETIGNLSSASVPATLARLGPVRGGAAGPLLVCGFGGGLSIGAALLALDGGCVFGSVDVEG